MAKDILTTHCVYWPTMLMACDIDLPKSIFAHGWWLIDNMKMSKSIGNVVRPLDLANEYGSDSLRYYLMRNMVLGQDSTFTTNSFIERYNADLANDYGNVVNRVVILIKQYYDSKIPEPGEYNDIDKNLINQFNDLSNVINLHLESLKIHELIEIIFSKIRLINKYLEEKEPWKTYKTNPNQGDVTATTLYVSIECIRICTKLLNPIMPNKTKLVLNAIGSKESSLKFEEINFGQEIDCIPTLFPRIELK